MVIFPNLGLPRSPHDAPTAGAGVPATAGGEWGRAHHAGLSCHSRALAQARTRTHLHGSDGHTVHYFLLILEPWLALALVCTIVTHSLQRSLIVLCINHYFVLRIEWRSGLAHEYCYSFSLHRKKYDVTKVKMQLLNDNEGSHGRVVKNPRFLNFARPTNVFFF